MNLEKSLRTMDNILNSPGRNPVRMSRQSNTPQRRVFDNDGHTEYDASFYLPKEMKVARNTANLSLTFHQWELANDTVLQGLTTASQENVGRQTIFDRLFDEFLITMQSRASGQVFETLGDLIQTCSDTLELAKSKKSKSQKKNSNLEMWWLANERNTWRLLYCLYQNRLNKQLFPESMDIESANSNISEKEFASHLYGTDNSIYESQLVIDWLEKNSLDELEEDVSRPEHFTDHTVAWENTLHQLQNQNTKIPYSSSRPIITHMDPDAPMRERLPLHDIDSDDDDRLVKRMFREIRCGRLEEAQELCLHCGQPWRAATLEGWRLHHDPNYATQAVMGAEKTPAEGNPMRDIWKQCAWQLSEDKRMSAYERAAYGALCGNVAAVLPVCLWWSDQLWARLRAAVDVRVEQKIRESMTRRFEKMPDKYWQNNLNLQDIFTELSSCGDEQIRNEATKPEFIIQQLLIVDNVPGLMREMHSWLDKCVDNAHFIRYLAHIVLVLRQLGANRLDDIGNEVLHAYIKILIKQGNPRLVAYYVSMLPPADQVHRYAMYLTNVTEQDKRQECLEAAEQVDLDVEAITKAVVENIRKTALEEDLSDLQANLTAEDLKKISALDWVVVYPTQRAEALWQSNALIRHFLAVGKVEAARKAINKIPGDSIILISKQHSREFVDNEIDFENSGLPPKIASSIREHFCHRSYLDAQESFSDWFEHFHNAKPVAPVKPMGGSVTFTERVAFDHRKKIYETELERWKTSMNMQTKLAKKQLYNVLLFPEGGWLVDSTVDSLVVPTDEERGRSQQLRNLRQLCLPGVVLLLQSVMHDMGEYDECVRLADIVVDEKYQIYEVYTKQKLADLLLKLCQSSIPLMNEKKDAWGYPM